MIRSISTLLVVLTALSFGCQSRKTGDASSKKETGLISRELEARLGTTTQVFKKDSVLLSFIVYNNADTARQFCKWETPFEPVLGKYLDVKDEQGNEAVFKGAMARRMMPPPPESYISVPAHDSVKTVFNLAKNYTLTNGKYHIRYTGGGISGLKDVNEVKVEIAD